MKIEFIHWIIFSIIEAVSVVYCYKKISRVNKVNGTIADIQEKDKETRRFFSPHKSYLVNIGNIKGYDKKMREIIFYEDHRCPITRMKIGKLKAILEELKG